MKSITEIIGGAQILLGLSFDIQECFEEYLGEEHRAFLAMLRVVEEAFPREQRTSTGRGRPPIDRNGFKKAFLAMNFFQTSHMSGLLRRLESDAVLRKICGFSTVPSPASFSRRMAEMAKEAMVTRMLNFLTTKYHRGKIIGHLIRDSTAVEAREKPVNKKKDIVLCVEKKRKRGRPRKDEPRGEKKRKRLARQVSMRPGKALSEIDLPCAWGCKRNSQGNVSFWKGYKLHLDVTDLGIPVTAVVTGANVHDSQVALPMEKLSERKVTHLYSVMDCAYDAPEIRNYITNKGRSALIDQNARRGTDRVPFDPARKERFKVRTVVERANSHLKDHLIPKKIFVRGHDKVAFQVLCGVVCLAAVKILQYYILPELQT